MQKSYIEKKSFGRRSFLKAGFAAATVVGFPRLAAADDSNKILIGYWPIASGLPLYLGVEAGLFKEAGLQVEAVKFAGAPQVVEAMLAGRIHGTANGTASGALALGEIASPGLFKVVASNPSNVKYVLDEFVVAANNPAKRISDLAGKRLASPAGIQNVTLAKAVLEKNGIANPRLVELPIGQIVPAIASGQIDGAYALEPVGTIGRLQGVTRTLETGVIAKYVLGDANAPWFGGSATLSSQFLQKNPLLAQKYIAAYRKAIASIRANPGEARRYLSGYTAIEDAVVKEVPLSGFTMYDEFTPADLAYFQKFFDVFYARKIFTQRVIVQPLLYRS